MSDICTRFISQAALQAAKLIDCAIEDGISATLHLTAKEAIADIHSYEYPGGRRVLAYKGKPFLELMPLEFKSEPGGDGSYFLNVVQRYRVLETPKQGKQTG